MLRNFVFVTRMSCDLRNSLHTSPLFNSLRMNGATLLTQSGGNPLIERNGRNTSLCFWSLTLWKLNTQSKIIQSKLILKVSTVTKTMDLVEVYLPSQLKLLISVSEKVISKWPKNPMEMVLAEIHPRTPLEISQNGSPRSHRGQCLEYLTTSTMNHSKNTYKWFIYWNNVNGAWGSHWKHLHK